MFSPPQNMKCLMTNDGNDGNFLYDTFIILSLLLGGHLTSLVIDGLRLVVNTLFLLGFTNE